jgi:hypothetical protein
MLFTAIRRSSPELTPVVDGLILGWKQWPSADARIAD